MYYQRITPDHAQAFFNLRLKSVTDHPEAFSTTPQEELAIPLTVLKDKLHPTHTPLYLAFGAFTPDQQLVGRCVLYQGDLPGRVHFSRVLLPPLVHTTCVQGHFRGRPPTRHKKTAHKATLSGVYVLPSFQRQGIARTLLLFALNYAKTTPLQQVNLSVTASNLPAIRLYSSLFR